MNVCRLLRLGRQPRVRLRAHVVAIRALSTEFAVLRTPKAIHVHYPALVATLDSAQPPDPSLTRPQLLALLDVLATSGRPPDLQRVEEILNHMPSLFAIPVTLDIHTVIIRGLIKHANDATILRWLLSMPSRPVPFTPTLDQFHIFLDACLQFSPFRFIRHAIRSMRQTGCKPTNHTFTYLIRSRWDNADQEGKMPHVRVFSAILDDMLIANLPYDPSIERLLYSNYADRGFTKYGEELVAVYRLRFPDNQTLEKIKEAEWATELSGVAQTQGVKAAIHHFHTEIMPNGCTPSPQIFRALLRHSSDTESLKVVGQEFDTPLTVDMWSIVIANNVRSAKSDVALSVYAESKNAGVVPDAVMVHPLLRALCQPSSNTPTEADLDAALVIYNDLTNATTPQTSNENSNEPPVGPDSAIYHTLLRGLASSKNLAKYFPIAKDLLNDMETRKISKSDSHSASSIITLFMRSANTLSDALDIYYGLRSSLDEKGYAVVLDEFCKLSFGERLHVPSLSHYFEIVKDMRRAGLEITVEVYTILLHQLGVTATNLHNPKLQTPTGLRDQLIATTRRTHDFLTLDAAVSPDEQVWNQLMDTYQRLGCFGDAYRVWDTMYLSGRFDHVSVSIILDACGYAGAWPVAKKISTQLFRDCFSFNLHNWNSWIECLCRLGRLNDAVKVVCTEMGKNDNNVPPSVETARILVKFARRANQEDVVLQRLEQYLPKLWNKLPEDIRAVNPKIL